MPRKGKGSKRPKNTGLDAAKQSFWQDRIRAGLKERQEYDETAKRVESYFAAEHEASFDNDEATRAFMDFDGVVVVSVPKVAQARNSLGPHLYPANTKRTVTAKTDDGVLVGLARTMQQYLNYTPEEAGYDEEARESIDDSILSGRGLLKTTFNDTLGIVTSEHVSSLDFVVDPDAKRLKHAEWIAIRRHEPLFRLKRDARREDLWRFKGLDRDLPKGEERRGNNIDADYADKPAEPEYGPTNRMIEVYTVYSKMGSGVRGLDFDGDQKRGTPKDNNDWVQLEIVLDHEWPLSEREWEVPLYLDDAWPVVELDLVKTPNRVHPISLMGQVLGLQRSIDILTTIRLASCKQHGRTIVLGDASLEPASQDLIRSGPETVYVPVELSQGQKLAEKFHVMNMGAMSPELGYERDYLEREMEETTGVTKTVTGASHQGSQDRSATATQLRSQATSVRLSDMKSRVEKWSGRAARHEAIYMRLELDAEDVTRYVRTSEIAMLYVRIEVPGGASVPLRDMRTERERQSDEDRGTLPLTLMEIAPSAATFFDNKTPEGAQEAAKALMDAWEAISDSSDPRVMELAQTLGPPGQETNPETGETYETPPESMSLAPVTVEDVWRETSDLTAQDLMREFGYKLASGSVPITDVARLQDQQDSLLQNVLPVAINNGDYNTANAILRNWQDVNDFPDDKRIPELQPPPAPPQPQQAPPA